MGWLPVEFSNISEITHLNLTYLHVSLIFLGFRGGLLGVTLFVTFQLYPVQTGLPEMVPVGTPWFLQQHPTLSFISLASSDLVMSENARYGTPRLSGCFVTVGAEAHYFLVPIY